MPAHSECRNCPLYRGCLTIGMDGRGPERARLMIVGEGPGRHEDARGQPFVGESGRLLDMAMREAGIDPDSVRITNAVRCRPPGNRTPTADEIRACRAWLDEEIAAVDPDIIIAAGNSAMRSLLKTSGVEDKRGQEYPAVIAGRERKVIPTYHPAAVLRHAGRSTPSPYNRWWAALVADLRRAARLLGGQPSRVTFEIVEGRLDAALTTAPVVWYDVEIDDAGRPILVTLASSSTGARVFAVRPDAFRDELRAILSRENVLVVGHNIKADNRWMRQIGVEVGPNQYDTMIAAHRINENRRVGLKKLAIEYWDADVYWERVAEDIKKRRDAIPWEELVRYSAHDVAYTAKLYAVTAAELQQRPRLWTTFRQLDMALSRVFEHMEDRGIYLDREWIARVIDEAAAIQRDAEASMNAILGREVNWNSYPQVSAALYDRTDGLGLPMLEFTEDGEPSTDYGVLLRLRDRHPLILHLLRWRRAEGYRRMATAWGDRVDKDGWIRSIQWKVSGTRTGRVSSADPNAQNLHRPQPGWPNIRNIIAAPPGYVILGRDYSQIELRVAAWLFDERTMLRMLQNQEDIHFNFALEVYREEAIRTATLLAMQVGVLSSARTRILEEFPEWKERRNRAKIGVFGYIYGLEAAGFREYAFTKYDLDLTLQEAEEIRQRFFEMFPGLIPAYRRVADFLDRHGYVESPLGRRRHLPDWYSANRATKTAALREAINAPVQGTASDLASIALILTSQELDIIPILHLHDAIYWYVPANQLSVAVEVTGRIMAQDVPKVLRDWYGIELPIPLESEACAGSHLGALDPV